MQLQMLIAICIYHYVDDVTHFELLMVRSSTLIVDALSLGDVAYFPFKVWWQSKAYFSALQNKNEKHVSGQWSPLVSSLLRRRVCGSKNLWWSGHWSPFVNHRRQSSPGAVNDRLSSIIVVNHRLERSMIAIVDDHRRAVNDRHHHARLRWCLFVCMHSFRLSCELILRIADCPHLVLIVQDLSLIHIWRCRRRLRCRSRWSPYH